MQKVIIRYSVGNNHTSTEIWITPHKYSIRAFGSTPLPDCISSNYSLCLCSHDSMTVVLSLFILLY